MLDHCDPIPTQQKISASRVEVAELILICNYDHPSERKTLKSWDLKKGQSLIHYKKKKITYVITQRSPGIMNICYIQQL